MFKRWILFVLVGVLGAACAPNTAPIVQVPPVDSTPYEVLVADVNTRDVFAQQQPTPVGEDVVREADAEHLLLANLYDRLAPSVVSVEVVVAPTDEIPFEDIGNGSGFIYDLNGHVVTNAHVILDADAVRVTFNDGYVADATVVGYDTYSDLAVLKIDVNVERLRPIPLGDSDAVRVGERAIVIGNPFGLTSSMTTGIISAKGRQLPSAELLDNSRPGGFQNPSIIQVDADINPGNSGGPLLNSYGEVIGVNTAIRTQSGVFEGVGFSVPSSTVSRVVPDLIANGQVDYAWLGISAMSSADGYGVASLADALNLPVTSGVMVSSVSPESPAAAAGLRGGDQNVEIRGRAVCVGGDIIVAINDRPIANMDELVTYLVTYVRPGDSVTLRVIRDRETVDLTLDMISRPAELSPMLGCGQ